VIFVDTGYFLALAMPGDALHHRAMMWANVVSEPFLVTEYVLWEIINALSAPRDRAKGHLILSQIQASPRSFEVVHASPELFSAGMKMHRDRLDKGWSLTDCISFHIMAQRGIQSALAFDQHFEQAGFQALLRKDAPNGQQ
jgi:predicted nucleic acid-binding protein